MAEGDSKKDKPTGQDEALTATTLTVSAAARDQSDDGGDDAIELPRGALVNRYILLGQAGRGGMGVVYRAYDPKLDRKIALKHVRRVGEAEDRARLLREAQAMARLSHPNVVNVYDALEHDDRLFLAMEWIEGRTLGKWLREESRSWRQIIAVFIDAAHGLAAAHRAGIVHRDFKPANVLVGLDESARVTDFGVAHVGEGEEDGDTDELALSSEDSSDSAGTLSGHAVGTLRYMAPEQHRGESDERSDQFSFCIALSEALYRDRRIWTGRKRKRTGKPERPDLPRGGVPRRISNALQRGLSFTPADRFPSMDALAAAIAPTRGRAALWVQLGALATMAAVAGGLFYTRDAKEVLCRNEDALFAGVWDEEVRREMRAVFEATGRAYADPAFESVAGALDARAERWVVARREACEATRVRGDQSEQMLDARTACLDQRLAEMRAFTRGLRGSVEPDAIDDIVTGARMLPAIDTCARVGGAERAPPAENEEEKERRQRLRARMAENTATQALGRFSEALEDVEPLSADAARTTDPHLRVEALYTVALALQRGGKRQASLEAFYRVAREAAAAGRDEIAAAAWNYAILVLGPKMARYEHALMLEPVAQAALARLEDDRFERSQLLENIGHVQWRLGHYEEAERLLLRALELGRAADPQHLTIGHTLNTLGLVAYARGQFAEAQSFHEQATAHWERTLGEGHPHSATGLINLANDLRAQGRLDETRTHYERAIEIWEAALGQHVNAAAAHNNLGLLLLEEERLDEAIVEFERALAMYEAAAGPEAPDRGYPLLGLAAAHLMNDPWQALPYAEAALALWKQAYPDAKPLLASAHSVVGSGRLETGDAAGAIESFERSLALWKDNPPPPLDLADAHFGLARALAKARGQSTRSLALARAALEAFESAGERAATRADGVAKWLDEHGGR